MLEKVREWLRSIFAGQRTPTEAQARATDQRVRQKRAELVAGLHADVSRLQQEILELSNATAPQVNGDDAPVDARITALERDLAAKQRELSENDWLASDNLVACPDPDEELIMKIERLAPVDLRKSDLT